MERVKRKDAQEDVVQWENERAHVGSESNRQINRSSTRAVRLTRAEGREIRAGGVGRGQGCENDAVNARPLIIYDYTVRGGDIKSREQQGSWLSVDMQVARASGLCHTALQEWPEPTIPRVPELS